MRCSAASCVLLLLLLRLSSRGRGVLFCDALPKLNVDTKVLLLCVGVYQMLLSPEKLFRTVSRKRAR
jgi:hypothetical protein